MKTSCSCFSNEFARRSINKISKDLQGKFPKSCGNSSRQICQVIDIEKNKAERLAYSTQKVCETNKITTFAFDL
jgi:hypothetical protein